MPRGGVQAKTVSFHREALLDAERSRATWPTSSALAVKKPAWQPHARPAPAPVSSPRPVISRNPARHRFSRTPAPLELPSSRAPVRSRNPPSRQAASRASHASNGGRAVLDGLFGFRRRKMAHHGDHTMITTSATKSINKVCPERIILASSWRRRVKAPPRRNAV